MSGSVSIILWCRRHRRIRLPKACLSCSVWDALYLGPPSLCARTWQISPVIVPSASTIGEGQSGNAHAFPDRANNLRIVFSDGPDNFPPEPLCDRPSQLKLKCGSARNIWVIPKNESHCLISSRGLQPAERIRITEGVLLLGVTPR